MRWLVFLSTLVAIPALAQVELAPQFADNMVIQRNQPIRVWGKAAPGEQLELRFNGRTQTTTVAPDSCWQLVLRPMAANPVPQTLEIRSGNHRVQRTNILIGDVWLCSGQSNMEWAFSRDAFFEEEKSAANQPLIRLYNTSFAGKYIYGTLYTDSVRQRLTPERFYEGQWETCTEQSARPMSAVAYYFAKKITSETGVPVGLINLAIGGAPIETFIDSAALAGHPVFRQKLAGNWLENPSLPEWIRERGRQNLGDQGNDHAYKPGYAFKSSIPWFSRLPIAGVLFYQGESNSLEAERVSEFGGLMQLMVKSLRDSWKNPSLPFYYAQLSSIDTSNYQAAYWPLFRDLQRRQLDSIPYSGMAVTSDKGHPTDVHPRDKRTVGYRFAALALYHQYGKKKTVYSGPQLKSVTVKRNRIIARFRHTAGGLTTSDGQPLRELSFNGSDPVNAILKKKKIIIPYTEKPAYLYYGWAPYSKGNLVNDAGLPASTFSTKLSEL
ncbi:MAG TPA: sialate O-acetylesterase [Flavihumibacter sp.]|jgi:sialate O-acetylesterase